MFSDLRTWGWLMLLFGVLLILAAMGVFAGSGFSRWFGIFAASLGMIGQFSAMNMYPLWSLVVITCSHPRDLRTRGVRRQTRRHLTLARRGSPCRSRARGSPSFCGCALSADAHARLLAAAPPPGPITADRGEERTDGDRKAAEEDRRRADPESGSASGARSRSLSRRRACPSALGSAVAPRYGAITFSG